MLLRGLKQPKVVLAGLKNTKVSLWELWDPYGNYGVLEGPMGFSRVLKGEV